MAGCEKDATGEVSLSDDMACGRCAENAILANDQFLDTICCTDLCNLLNDFRVVVSSIATNDKFRALDTFRNREEDRSCEGFGVVILLEYGDLLSQTRRTRPIARVSILPLICTI